jgi:PAS domain S-box-containing protein
MSISRNAPEPAGFSLGSGEMAGRIRELDWSRTPLGPMDSWSPGLRTVVRLLLANRFPHLLWWGPSYVQIYNDAYRPIPGAKHPERALGRPASECWAEIWNVIGPLIDRPYRGGPPTWDDDILLEIDRHGFLEESHFTIAYSPVPDEAEPGGIGGVLATVQEITGKVVGERRVVALRDLGASLVEAKSAERACAIAAETLGRHPRDLPFVIVYLADACGERATLCGAAGVAPGEDICPLTVDLREPQAGWPFAGARESSTLQVVECLAERFACVPPGPWSDPPTRAAVVPLPSSKAGEPAGYLVAGLSVRLVFDEYYRDFLELLKTQVASSIANARAYEEERKRAEVLAELDRAKTDFFSNVSHEFRTPLTLMLGPVEELLDPTSAELSPPVRERLELVQRNSLRLLRLVNTMLDFSRIEAGRIQAQFEPVDLAALTVELASVFRSAIEHAGLRLVVDCPPLAESVYVDRSMWEKIVLNLLSNALKFTLEGEIEVRLQALEGRVRLDVRDTGVGIPPEELPRMFERFHRVRNVRSRTHEGTGIGLALVQELTRLHGGTVGVESVPSEGTRFSVTIPLGHAHLDPGGLVQASPGAGAAHADGARAFVEEALRWLPDAPRRPESTEPKRARVLWADDNADMRDYVRRLLSERFEVEAAPDGRAALDAARARPPDLVLADVMMPRLDGFGLLRELRADARLASIPVILLSARAGEEARIEGVGAGADDYLIKPFSARELLARVDAHVRIDRQRKHAEAALREREHDLQVVIDAMPALISYVDADGRYRFANRSYEEWFGLARQDVVGRAMSEVLGAGAVDALQPHVQSALRGEVVHFETQAEYRTGSRWIEGQYIPDAGPDGRVRGFFVLVLDVTERKRIESERERTEAALRESRQELLRQRSALEELNRTLEQRVVERSMRLRALAAELAQTEQRERARLAQILHDHLQQLLVAAKLRLGAVIDAASGGRFDQLLLDTRAVLDESIEASRSLAVELSPPVLNQQGLAAALEWLARFMLDRHALHVELVLDRKAEPDNPDVRFLLFQAVRELLLNVVKHAGVDRAMLTMGRSADGQIEITVRDGGSGFDPASLPPSAGFGLFSVEQRLAAIGGTLGIEAARPGGTTVTLGAPLAPRVTAESVSPAPRGSAQPTRGPLPALDPTDARIRVLLADDHDFVRQGLVELLGSEPDIVVVGEASNGIEALELAERLEPQIVVMDVGMPRLDGIETTRRIKSRLPRVRVVALSMHEEDSIASEMREAGADAYLTKDRALDQLAAAIRKSAAKPIAAD